MQSPQLIEFISNGNESIGFLSSAEYGNLLPFELKRAYWIYHTPEMVQRGGHAHKEDELVIICVAGEAVIEVENTDGLKTNFLLNKPSLGLYIPKMYWRELRLNNHATLFCLSSSHYNEEDYIRSYQEFRNHNSSN